MSEDRPGTLEGADRDHASGGAAVVRSRSSLRTAQAVARRLGLIGRDVRPQPIRPLSAVSAAVIFALAVALAYLFVGLWFVAVTAVLAIVTMRFNPDPGRPFAFAVVALLTGAAAVTVLVVPPKEADPQITFAQERVLAAELGSFAGVFLAIATMMFAVMERPLHGARPDVGRRAAVRVGRRDPGWVSDIVGVAWPVLAAAVAGVVVRAAAGPAGLPAEVRPLLENLRLGTLYSLEVGGGATPDASWPPLGPLLAAYLPLGPRGVTLGLTALLITGAAWAAWQVWDRGAAVWAAWAAAVVPPCWALALTELGAATALILAAGLVLRPKLPGAVEACGVAALGAIAVLARPDAVVGALLLGAVLVVRAGSDPSRPASRRIRIGVIWIAVSAVVVSPWSRYVSSEFGFPWISPSLGELWRDPVTSVSGVLAAAVALSAVVLLALLVWSLRTTERSDRLAVVVALSMVGWCLATAALAGRPAEPLSWSAPIAVVVVAGVRPWSTRARAPERRSDHRGRRSSSGPAPDARAEAPR